MNIRIANLQSYPRISLVLFCFKRCFMMSHLFNLIDDLEINYDLSLWNFLIHSSCLDFIKMQDMPSSIFNQNLSFMAL